MRDARTESAALERECAAFCRYLAGRPPSRAVLARYLDAHAQGIVCPAGSARAFDMALVRAARIGAPLARACDVHARLFRPAGLLRRKLVLTLALLEVDREAHSRVEGVEPGSRAGLLVGTGFAVLRFALLALLGLVVFVPLRLACAMAPQAARSA